MKVVQKKTPSCLRMFFKQANGNANKLHHPVGHLSRIALLWSSTSSNSFYLHEGKKRREYHPKGLRDTPADEFCVRWSLTKPSTVELFILLFSLLPSRIVIYIPNHPSGWAIWKWLHRWAEPSWAAMLDRFSTAEPEIHQSLAGGHPQDTGQDNLPVFLMKNKCSHLSATLCVCVCVCVS